MEFYVYHALPIAMLIAASICFLLRTRTRSPHRRRGLGKLAMGAVGSSGIVWSVYLVADFLQLLVIACAIGYLAKWLTIGRASLVRSAPRKKLGQAA